MVDDCAHNVTVSEALRIIADRAEVLGTEPVDLAESLGRVLAASVASDHDYPPFDRTIMDGYAVRSADLAGGRGRLRCVGSVAAGGKALGKVGPGEAMQINTGAPIPEGANAVVMVEKTRLSEDGVFVELEDRPAAGQFINTRGSATRAGREVLSAGTVMGPSQIAVAAAVGAGRLSVYRQPRVAVLVPGDELVDIDVKPTGSQIRNSNGYGMAAMVRQSGGTVVDLGVGKDNRAALTAKIEEGLSADVFCITGGVSMGAYDYVPELLEACGVRPFFRKVAVKPGHPTLFGRREGGAFVFGLPGNPVSCLVGYWLWVRPLLSAMQGRATVRLPMVRARLGAGLGKTGGRETYRPARVETTADGELTAAVVASQGSGDPFGLGQANGLIMTEANARAVAAGESVRVLLVADG
jgi:molybdopterin molybdotransferase